MNKLQQAIGASYMTNSEMMEIVGLSAPTWYKRISDPSSLTVGEYRLISKALDDTSRSILVQVLEEVEAEAGDVSQREVDGMRLGDLFRIGHLAGADVRGIVLGGAA